MLKQLLQSKILQAKEHIVNTVQIDEVIQSEDWLEGECLNLKEKTTCKFHLRILKFEPAENYEFVYERILSKMKSAGVFWILDVEVVNTSKESINGRDIRISLSLIDGDGYRFEPCNGTSLQVDALRGSKFNQTPLLPKVKVSAAFVFELPNQEHRYNLASLKASIRKRQLTQYQ